jgi:hypothetical protein
LVESPFALLLLLNGNLNYMLRPAACGNNNR